MADKTVCTLCGHTILENVPRSEFTEGTFCSDGAGCRRRALSLRTALVEIDHEIKVGREGAPASTFFIERIVDKALGV